MIGLPANHYQSQSTAKYSRFVHVLYMPGTFSPSHGGCSEGLDAFTLEGGLDSNFTNDTTVVLLYIHLVSGTVYDVRTA